ncbi:MAG TPA: ABC transporter permease subunit [Bryobacteraceae bacterium]|jgi:sodium transport system permease protein|nr:ABC transporter permease subunit [Bryobacteraceae bacterium]
MRLSIVSAIYRKEMLDLVRDRRTMISMVVVPVLLIPLLLNVSTRLMSRMEENAELEAKSMAVAVKVTTPALRQALEKAQIQIVDQDDLKDAVLKKTVAAAVEEIPGSPVQVQIYADNSSRTSSAAAARVRTALDDLRDEKVRESLKNSGIPESVLTPFVVKRTNIAGARKMAGMAWGSILGYLLLLMMFTGGMYPIIDMTAGEKERKTMEALLAAPASRMEIVLGKNFAAMTAILITAILTLGSLTYSLKSTRLNAKSPEMEEMMRTIPLDAHTLTLIAVTLVPLAMFAASLMFAIALFARSYKEGQSYLMPLLMVVIFPALMGGLSGMQMTPAMCLIPIFNVSQMIRGILLGDFTTANFAMTTVANLAYAAIAFLIATRQFENENVLFRS